MLGSLLVKRSTILIPLIHNFAMQKGLTKLISLNSVRPFLSVSHILPDNHRIPDK